MKKLLIILGILVLLVIGVLFVPPIYNRFTKPFFKNTMDAKEWYHQVDCENLTFIVKLVASFFCFNEEIILCHFFDDFCAKATTNSVMAEQM